MVTTALILAALAVEIPDQELSTFLQDRLDFSGSDLPRSKVERS